MRRIIGILIVAWLLIGALAAGQRHYFSGGADCAKASRVAVTIIAGPLNYLGVNPKVSCNLPQPSK